MKSMHLYQKLSYLYHITDDNSHDNPINCHSFTENDAVKQNVKKQLSLLKFTASFPISFPHCLSVIEALCKNPQ